MNGNHDIKLFIKKLSPAQTTNFCSDQKGQTLDISCSTEFQKYALPISIITIV